jgi:hypothetical protein
MNSQAFFWQKRKALRRTTGRFLISGKKSPEVVLFSTFRALHRNRKGDPMRKVTEAWDTCLFDPELNMRCPVVIARVGRIDIERGGHGKPGRTKAGAIILPDSH